VASLLRISTERAAAAFEVLAAADPHSRTKEQEGRRIIKMADGGWFLPSHAKHRRLASKEAAAERQRRHRERQRVEREAALTCETPGCKATVAGVVDGRRACRAHCFDKPVSAPDPEHEAVLERPRCSKPGCQNEQLRRNGNGLCLIHQPSIEIPYPGLSPLDDMIEEMIEDSGDGGAA
jgi:hypothetical protein